MWNSAIKKPKVVITMSKPMIGSKDSKDDLLPNSETQNLISK